MDTQDNSAFQLRVGTAFFDDPAEGKRHLHFVASNPQEPLIVVLNFTTSMEFSDNTFVAVPGDHPFIKVPTRIAWEKAVVTTAAHVQVGISTGAYSITDPISKELMQRVWEAADNTRNINRRARNILAEQGLVSTTPPVKF